MAWNDSAPSDSELKAVATWDHSPPTAKELTAAGVDTRSAGQKLANVFLSNLYPKSETPDSRTKEEKRAELEAYKRELPSALAGGATLLAPVPGGALARVGMGALSGGAIGALSPADSTSERISNAGIGALSGGVIGGAAEGILAGAKALKHLPAALQGKAEERAFKSAGAMLRDYRKAAGQDRINELGRFMLDNGLVKPGMAVDDIAAAAEQVMGQKGEAVEQLAQSLAKKTPMEPQYQTISAAKPVSSNEIQEALPNLRKPKLGREESGRFKSITTPDTIGDVKPTSVEIHGEQQSLPLRVKTGELPSKDYSTATSEIIGGVREDLKLPNQVAGTDTKGSLFSKLLSDQAEKLPERMSLDQVRNLKLEVKGLIKWDRLPGVDIPPKEQYYRALYSKLASTENSLAEKLASGESAEIAEQFIGAKKAYGNASEIARISKDQALRQNANRFLSPSDYLSGATGALVGAASGDSIEDKIKNAAIGGSLGLANKAARKYGTPLVSKALDRTGAVLAKSPIPALGNAATPVLDKAVSGPLSVGNVARTMTTPAIFPDAPVLPRVAQSKEPNRSPARGEDKWAQQGAQKLGLDNKRADQLMQSKEAKRLLIEASDVAPGSKRMQKIKEQLRKVGK